ncbi:MAG: sensor histidine kinase [Clostridia bacterium]|nr:sensor histidine kinase [Clostridia bacterium]
MKSEQFLRRLGAGYSISSRLRTSFIVLMTLLIIPCIVSVSVMSYYAGSYHAIISQVDRVSSIKPYVQTLIPEEIWSIVAGRLSFDEGAQYQCLDYVADELEELIQSAGANATELVVARRTTDTLRDYIDRMGEQMSRGEPVEQNELLLEEVRSVSALIDDMLTKYVDAEIVAASVTSDELQRMIMAVLSFIVLLIIATTVFSIAAQRSLSKAIQKPIEQLERFAGELAGGNIDARAPDASVDELRSLTDSLNTMASRLGDLIEENRREQESLKKSELRALQAQINPHFLYNTLDAIVWLAEARRYDEVIHITRALSDFFRISLSQGKDWITLGEEVRHLTGYLTIQKIRYRDILDYEIRIPPEIGNVRILKLLLQPLVENAIYHGIKHRRGKGVIIVSGETKGGMLTLSVEDNGAGMAPERLEEVTRALEGNIESPTPGYGLYNVNMRIKLYYNQPKGIQIQSDKNGTRCSLHVPMRGDGDV